jgi:hypothetical protein
MSGSDWDWSPVMTKPSDPTPSTKKILKKINVNLDHVQDAEEESNKKLDHPFSITGDIT